MTSILLEHMEANNRKRDDVGIVPYVLIQSNNKKTSSLFWRLDVRGGVPMTSILLEHMEAKNKKRDDVGIVPYTTNSTIDNINIEDN